MEKKICVYECKNHIYPLKENVFRPHEMYPEYPFSDISESSNYIYEGVRASFALLGLDADNYNTTNWNPLGKYISQGNTVLIKPNLVMDYNQNTTGGVDCLYTHPSIVAAVLDYVIVALKGKGRIIIGDAPMQECNFQKLINESGYKCLVDYYKSMGYDISIVDFRELSSVVKNGVHYSSINGDAKGKIINLGVESEFYGNNEEGKIRITNYDPRILPTHHRESTQEYYISDYVLEADVIINMPKPKTHRKAGVTISLKNFVGANVRKEFLPHHTMGSLKENGDEYLNKSTIQLVHSKLLDKRNIYAAEKKYRKAQLLNILARICYKAMKVAQVKYFEGSWYGNQTISKTICDLNKIVYYSDKDGILEDEKQRKIFIVADMVISGEKEGPVCPSPKDVGVIAMGDDPLLFDEAIAKIMGFDCSKIPTFNCVRKYRGKYNFYSEEDSALIVSNISKFDKLKPDEIKRSDSFGYIPTSGWMDHIESR